MLLESELKEALIRLNPALTQNPDLAEEVIYNLRAILISVHQVGLIQVHEEKVMG